MDDFQRNRRALMVVSVVLVLCQLSGIRFKKISVLGNSADVDSPEMVVAAMWCVWAYFIYRTWQKHQRGLFYSALRARAAALAGVVAAREPFHNLISIAKDDLQDRYRDLMNNPDARLFAKQPHLSPKSHPFSTIKFSTQLEIRWWESERWGYVSEDLGTGDNARIEIRRELGVFQSLVIWTRALASTLVIDDVGTEIALRFLLAFVPVGIELAAAIRSI